MVSPVIKRLAGEFKGRILTIKVDVDKKPEVANRYQITSIPTIMLFKDGRPSMRIQGAQPYSAIKNQLQKALM